MPLYEISLAAEQDWRNIVRYTLKNHGEKLTRKYMQQLEDCIENMANGEGYYKEMDDLYPSIRMKHCEHHYVFGLIRDAAPMLVVAIFHERMDLMVQLENRL